MFIIILAITPIIFFQSFFINSRYLVHLIFCLSVLHVNQVRVVVCLSSLQLATPLLHYNCCTVIFGALHLSLVVMGFVTMFSLLMISLIMGGCFLSNKSLSSSMCLFNSILLLKINFKNPSKFFELMVVESFLVKSLLNFFNRKEFFTRKVALIHLSKMALQRGSIGIWLKLH